MLSFGEAVPATLDSLGLIAIPASLASLLAGR